MFPFQTGIGAYGEITVMGGFPRFDEDYSPDIYIVKLSCRRFYSFVEY